MNELEFENLSAWLDGEVSGEEQKVIESTLQIDQEANIAFAELRKLDELLQKYNTPAPKPELKEIICISARHYPRGNLFFRSRYLVPLTTAALFILAVLMFTMPWNGPTVNSSISQGFQWQSMTIEQRLQARKEARAFLRLSPQQQRELLEKSAKEMSLDTGDSYLGAVMASFTSQQLQQLKRLSHQQRMEIVQQRKQELISKGIITE